MLEVPGSIPLFVKTFSHLIDIIWRLSTCNELKVLLLHVRVCMQRWGEREREGGGGAN